MRNDKARKLGLYLSLAFLTTLVGLKATTAAGLPILPGQQAVTAVLNYFSDPSGKLRIDVVNNRFVFGSTTAANGAVLTSSGTLVVQSTSATAGYKLFRLLNNAGTELLSMAQGGDLTIAAGGKFQGDGSALTGLPGLASTSTWSGSNTYSGPGVTSTTFNNIGVIGSGASGFFSVDTVTYFSAASNLAWVPWTDVRQLVVEGCGQGSGGSAITTNPGTAGSSTTWISADGSTIAANGGGAPGGVGAGQSPGTGGTGGAGGNTIWSSSSVFHCSGNAGSGEATASGYFDGGSGGGSCYGGGGAPGVSGGTGANAPANSGGGGSGGAATSTGAGAGGSGAECFKLTISSPSIASKYWLTVGSLGGQGGAAGTVAGGNGGTGFIRITGKH